MNIEYVSTLKAVPCDGCDNHSYGFTAIYSYHATIARLCHNCYHELVKAITPIILELEDLKRNEAATQERREANDDDE